MKMIGLCMVLVSCTLGGFLMDLSEKKRIAELNKLIYLFELLKGEIDYCLTPIQEAALKVSEHGDLAGIFSEFARLIGEKNGFNLAEMWERVLASKKNKLHLNDEDLKEISQFGVACGYLDKTMQEKNIDLTIMTLKDVASRAARQYEKTSKLNRYLGFLVGACITIFLI